MEKTDREKHNSIDRIGKKASKELSALDTSGKLRLFVKLGSVVYSLMQFADEMKISREVMLAYASNALFETALSESGKSENPTMNIYESTDHGFKQ